MKTQKGWGGGAFGPPKPPPWYRYTVEARLRLKYKVAWTQQQVVDAVQVTATQRENQFTSRPVLMVQRNL